MVGARIRAWPVGEVRHFGRQVAVGRFWEASFANRQLAAKAIHRTVLDAKRRVRGDQLAVQGKRRIEPSQSRVPPRIELAAALQEKTVDALARGASAPTWIPNVANSRRGYRGDPVSCETGLTTCVLASPVSLRFG
jgi:hypothetical protein